MQPCSPALRCATLLRALSLKLGEMLIHQLFSIYSQLQQGFAVVQSIARVLKKD